MLKLVLAAFVCSALLASACADVEVVSAETNVEHDGKFHYHYELNDGSKVIEDGVLKHVNAEHDGEAVEGQFEFIADDGKPYSVSYTADENGFRPVGAHLPTPPPIPESVLKTLKYLEEHPYQPEDKKHH